MKVLTLLFCMALQSGLSAADYFQYGKQLNRIDELLIRKQLPETLPLLDSLRKDYSFIFARHCIKALQICNALNDESRTNYWLQRSILAGIPGWYFRQLPTIKSVFRYESNRKILSQFDSLHQVYLSRVNRKLSKYIDSLFVIDQFRTDRVNNGTPVLRYTIYGLQWLHNNKKQFKLFEQLIHTYGYPGERLIGLTEAYDDSGVFFRNGIFRFTQFDEHRMYYMFIHCYSSKRRSLDPYFMEAVRNGFLPAYQYASYNDFMASYGYRIYRNNFYNEWHKDPDKSHQAAIDQRRLAIGLCSLEALKQRDVLLAERFRNKTYYETIFLE